MRRIAAAVLGGVGVAALVWAALAIAADIDCSGGGTKCKGTSEDDFIIGSNKKDVIDGKSGNDFADGRKGDDRISGGDDSDEYLIGGLFGGKGDDLIEGGDGNDDLYGDAGEDVLTGGPGDDQLVGAGAEPGDDRSKDRMSCGAGNDVAIKGVKDKVDDTCETVIKETQR